VNFRVLKGKYGQESSNIHYCATALEIQYRSGNHGGINENVIRLRWEIIGKNQY
jgi:hypothetical protein